jgi:hypothetical protein
LDDPVYTELMMYKEKKASANFEKPPSLAGEVSDLRQQLSKSEDTRRNSEASAFAQGSDGGAVIAQLEAEVKHLRQQLCEADSAADDEIQRWKQRVHELEEAAREDEGPCLADGEREELERLRSQVYTVIPLRWLYIECLPEHLGSMLR